MSQKLTNLLWPFQGDENTSRNLLSYCTKFVTVIPVWNPRLFPSRSLELKSHWQNPIIRISTIVYLTQVERSEEMKNNFSIRAKFSITSSARTVSN